MTNVLPLLVRAYDDTDPRMQEEVLRRTVSLAQQLDMKVMTFKFDFIQDSVDQTVFDFISFSVFSFYDAHFFFEMQ